MTRGQRFAAAMACYAVLALIATVQLDGVLRLAIWVFLAALAFKSWIGAYKRQ